MRRRELLRQQWTPLRAWIEESGLLDHRKKQSVLDEWNVHELDLPALGAGRPAAAALTRGSAATG